MSWRKRVLLIASTTGYQTQMFAEAADRIGFELALATDRCHVLENPWGDGAIAIRFDQPDQAAQAVAAQGRFDGIVALGDGPALVAASVAARIGVPYNSEDAVAACRDKFQARGRFQSSGLPVPEFFRVALGSDVEAAAERAVYPCVLKPLALSASRGVIRADSRSEFVAAFRRIAAMLRAPDFIQVERFIPGREFALEGLVTDGFLSVLALFDKPDPLDGPFFEETIYVTPSRESAATQAAIGETAARAVAALGLTQGPVHAEMRVNGEGVWMLEVAARPIGGLCARVLPGLPETILRHAVGEAGLGLPVAGAAGVMMIPIPRGGVYRDVAGVASAAQVPGIEDVVITAKQAQELVPLPEGASYLGFIFARGERPAEVERALRLAHAELRFEIAAALPVVIGKTT